MALIVQKYGGSSLATIDRLRSAAEKIIQTKKQGHQVVVVVSAMGDDTDQLVTLVNQITLQPSAREYDMLLTVGEQKAMALLAIMLQSLDCPARSMTGWQAGIKTSACFNTAKIVDIDTQSIQSVLAGGEVSIVAGFQGITEMNEITTIGRGGSDLTAVALASALNAKECQIYTDVDGVHTTDPRLVTHAPKIDHLSSEEMVALSRLGAQVLHSRAVELAGRLTVPLRVLSSFKEGDGTRISCPGEARLQPIAGIASCRGQVLLSFPDGSAEDVIKEIPLLSQDWVVQEDTSGVKWSIDRTRYHQIKHQLLTVQSRLHWEIQEGLALVSVVGARMTEADFRQQFERKFVASEPSIISLFIKDLSCSMLVQEAELVRIVRILHDYLGLENSHYHTSKEADISQTV